MNVNETIRIVYTSDTDPSSSPYTISISNHLFNTLQIDPGSKMWFRFGSERILVTCEAKLDDTYQTLFIPQELKGNHYLPSSSRPYSLTYSNGKNELHLGPMIGMLLEKRSKTDHPFGTLTDFACELNQYCHENHAVFYVFSIEDVRMDHIDGYRLEGCEWMKIRFPFPDVIYNRISNRTLERSEIYVQFFNHCRELGIPHFNDRFLSKWEVFSLLVDHNPFAAHLPKTIPLCDLDALKQHLHLHKTVFLKPIHGSEGKGILKVTKHPEHFYQIDVSKQLEKPIPPTTEEAVLHFIQEFVPKEQYILQQGINLMKHEDGTVDFRILCNRNEYGIWCITSSVARVAVKDQFVTNVSKGATLHPLLTILERQFNTQTARDIRSMLYEIAVETCNCLHEKAGGIFGEFGIDFGVDTDGHVWILEVNTKPSKQAGTTTRPPSSIRPSAKGVFLFAKHLFHQKA